MNRSPTSGKARWRFAALGFALGLAATSGATQAEPELIAIIDAIEERITLVDRLIEHEDAKLEELAERMDLTQGAEQQAQLAALHEQLTHTLDQLEGTKERLADQLETLRRQAAQIEQRHE